MPAPVAPTAPAPLTINDNNGNPVPVYAGAERDPFMDNPIVGDRGDSLEPATPPVVPPVVPPVPETPPNPVAPETPPTTPPETPPEGEDPPRDDQGRFVPKGRFNEVNDRMHAAEAEAKVLREQMAALLTPSTPATTPTPTEPATPPAFDFDAKELEYINLVLDGKAPEALALRKEIRSAEQDLVRTEARTANTQATSEQQLQISIATVAAGYEDRFPILKEGSTTYDPELVKDVQAIFAGNLQTGRYGDDTIKAWDQSIASALRMRGLDPTVKAPDPTPTPPPAPALTPKPNSTTAPRQEALNSQPPPISTVGTNGAPQTIDVMTMSGDDLAKLPVETQKRLRGDYL